MDFCHSFSLRCGLRKCCHRYCQFPSFSLVGVGEELDFSRGDEILVTALSGGSLWKGTCHGKEGVFPREFVDVLKDEEEVPVIDLVSCLMEGDVNTVDQYVATLPEEEQEKKRAEIAYMLKEILQEKGITGTSEDAETVSRPIFTTPLPEYSFPSSPMTKKISIFFRWQISC